MATATRPPHHTTTTTTTAALATTGWASRVVVVGLFYLLTLAHRLGAGVISLDEDDVDSPHGQQQQQQAISFASSFMEFHGPVEGPEFQVKVPYAVHHEQRNDIHGREEHLHQVDHGYTLDYAAHPKYEFSYGVQDYHTGDFHGQKETRDGSSVHGEYSVAEPGGTYRTVTYRADKDGFHAVVHTSGKTDHSTGIYGTGSVHNHVQAGDQEPETHHSSTYETTQREYYDT